MHVTAKLALALITSLGWIDDGQAVSEKTAVPNSFQLAYHAPLAKEPSDSICKVGWVTLRIFIPEIQDLIGMSLWEPVCGADKRVVYSSCPGHPGLFKAMCDGS